MPRSQIMQESFLTPLWFTVMGEGAAAGGASAVRLGTKAGVEGQALTIQTPLLRLSKADIVRLGTRLRAPFELTHSCYMGTEPSCGECDACLLRLKGFAEAGMVDPVAYII